MKNKKKTWKIVGNIIFALLIMLLIVPTSRAWMQQGLMKLGLFKPNLEKPKESDNISQQTVVSSDLNTTFSNDKGELVKVSDLKGKVVFINFWATWCPPCKAEMPSIEVLKDKFKGKDNIEFLLVEIEHAKEKAHAFLQEHNLDLPIYYPESQIPGSWLGGSIPATVILDKEGNLAAHHEGMADYSRKEVFDFLTELMNKE